MQLNEILSVKGKIRVVTGMHIGGGDMEMHIGGMDNPVIKNPVTNEPYIPGSSLKGKMRSLMEWYAGVVEITNGNPLNITDLDKLDGNNSGKAKMILKLFGYAPGNKTEDDKAKEIGPARFSFWDCNLDPEWIKEMNRRNLLLTEVKMENSINRIKGTSVSLRTMERVPAGAVFDFTLSIKVIDMDEKEDLLNELKKGLKLLELSGIGGSVSRGYGKIKFENMILSGKGEDTKFTLDKVSL